MMCGDLFGCEGEQSKKASKEGRLETVGSLVHSRRPGLQRPNLSALSDFPMEGIFLPASDDNHYR